MKKNTTRGLIVLVLLLCVFSVVSFVIPFNRTATFWVAYGFGAFALLFQLYIFKAANTAHGDAKSRFYGFPIVRVGTIYMAGQLVVSFIEMALGKALPVWVPVVVNLILAVVAIIGCITVETVRDEIIQQDGQLKKNVANMRELQSLSRSLVGQCQDESLRKMLESVADEFRYSDPVTSEATQELEADMHSQLGDIQQAIIDGDDDGMKKLCKKLMGCLTERNRICSISK